MKQSLQLRLGHQLTMTPQLQQAIRLLQLSSLELHLEIQTALDSNLMLELAEEGEEGNNPLAEEGNDEPFLSRDEFIRQEREAAVTALDGGDPGGALEYGEAEFASGTEDIPADLPVDSVWEEIYDSGLPASSGTDGGDGHSEFLAQQTSGESLYEHLAWQINLTPFNDAEREIALTLADAINGDGYLGASLAEILETVQANTGLSIAAAEVEAVLKQIQHLDPPGIAARNLAECLCIQLRVLPATTPWLKEAQQLVSLHLESLGARDYNTLMRKLKLNREALRETIALIQSLNPRPAAHLAAATTEYIVPDVIVRKNKGRWEVELNPETVPALRINKGYANLLRTARASDDTQSLKTHLQEARWFIKSIQSRSETLLRVSTAIVYRQQAFLDQGPEAMKPLVLQDIAKDLELHESTVSRVTTRKYLHTPRGIFELKYFFSSHINTEDEGKASSTAIRAVIKKLVDAEDAAKPLSDSTIAEKLLALGFQVARRTVAKYREGMHIPPSNERKRLA